jgi:hypothetical protein
LTDVQNDYRKSGQENFSRSLSVWLDKNEVAYVILAKTNLVTLMCAIFQQHYTATVRGEGRILKPQVVHNSRQVLQQNDQQSENIH